MAFEKLKKQNEILSQTLNLQMEFNEKLTQQNNRIKQGLESEYYRDKKEILIKNLLLKHKVGEIKTYEAADEIELLQNKYLRLFATNAAERISNKYEIDIKIVSNLIVESYLGIKSKT